MSIGFLNYDSSFFEVKIESFKNKIRLEQEISDRVISVEITEEMGKVVSGNVQLVDTNDFRFSNTLKGKRILIKWGYSNMDLSGRQASRKAGNPNELFSNTLVNRYVQGWIRSQSGAADENGMIIYNCSFIGVEFVDPSVSKNKRFASGTKKKLVENTFREMGVKDFYVNFKRQDEKLTRDTAVMKTTSNFKFLNKYAMEWRAMFRIATASKVANPLADPPEHNLVGIFCNYDDDNAVKAFLKKTLGDGVTGDTMSFEYKMSSSPNVKSYSWTQNQATGAGDNVRMVIINGKPEFFYTQAKNEEVIYYKLNTKKMEKELAGQTDVTAQAQWVEKMFSEAGEGFDNLVDKQYFYPVKEHTAPQGIGLEMNLEVIGNPLYTCPARAKFSAGFPDLFMTKKGLIFYIIKVNHKIDRSGYTCSIQIGDSYSVNGGSLVG